MSLQTLLQPSTSPTTHYSMTGTTSTDTVRLSHAITQACTFTLEDGHYIQAPILNCGWFYADFTKRVYHACVLFCCIRLYFPMGPIAARLAKIERKLTARIWTLLFKNAHATRLPYLIFWSGHTRFYTKPSWSWHIDKCGNMRRIFEKYILL